MYLKQVEMSFSFWPAFAALSLLLCTLRKMNRRWWAQAIPTFPSLHAWPQHPAPSKSPDFYPILCLFTAGLPAPNPRDIGALLLFCQESSPVQSLPGPHRIDPLTQHLRLTGGSSIPPSYKDNLIGDVWVLLWALLEFWTGALTTNINGFYGKKILGTKNNGITNIS